MWKNNTSQIVIGNYLRCSGPEIILTERRRWRRIAEFDQQRIEFMQECEVTECPHLLNLVAHLLMRETVETSEVQEHFLPVPVIPTLRGKNVVIVMAPHTFRAQIHSG